MDSPGRWRLGIKRPLPIGRVWMNCWPNTVRALSKFQGKNGQPILKKWTELLNLDHDLQSQLVIPLRTKEKVLGLLELGQLKPWSEAPFSDDNKKLAIVVAEQTSAYIERMMLYEQTRRREALLASLDETSRTIRAVKEHDKLLREVIRFGGQAGQLHNGRLVHQSPEL